ncbi:MAG: hypothetical protein Faunusvirus40_8 [Faunusvirus sp.]|jgi:hypothetical protein|uniref:Uncharacterized protein n=1 Tax=Faunusvirus sp. TaxID=2487766 RepID=A0A3G4ZXS9_9VIRU|nr:MAG: hypothetical protein Faunusvirus40_8 [Faunusvirus sp.]
MNQPSITPMAGPPVINALNKQDFDAAQFNKSFDQVQQINEAEHTAAENAQIQALNNAAPKAKTLDELTLADFLIGLTTCAFGIIYDLMNYRFDSFTSFVTIFTKNNRLFFIGTLLCIFSGLIYYLSQ